MKKQAYIIVTMLALITLGLSTANAQSGYTVVYPTGQFPADVTNVQVALDQGGTVLLKATNSDGQPTSFNFGPSDFSGGRVNVRGNVTLTGERVGSAMTTIIGGFDPIIVRPGANARIESLNLERSFTLAINARNPASVTIIGNRIAHVVGQFLRAGFSFGIGMEVVGGGNVVIANNMIDDIDAESGTGISQVSAWGPVEILGNRVSGTNTVAIESSASNSVRIERNTAIPGPERYRRFASGVAIEANGPGDYQIVDNTAVCVNSNAWCIFVFGTTGFFNFQPVIAPVINRNHVTTHTGGPPVGIVSDTPVGIVLFGQVSDAYVGQNTVAGTGFAALATFAAPVGTGSDLSQETFVGNNIARFNASFADVFFDEPTHDSVLAGFSGTVVDLGSRNRITGFTHLADQAHIGPQIGRAATQRIREIHEARQTARPVDAEP